MGSGARVKELSYYESVMNVLRGSEVEIRPAIHSFSKYDVHIKNTIARNLMTLRKDLGYSQLHFSKLIEVSLSQYKKYEAAAEIIRLDVAHRIALKLGYPIFHLFNGSPYDQFLDVPPENRRLRKLCYFSNSLTDAYFSQLCKILSTFSRAGGSAGIDAPHSGLVEQDFERALEENHTSIYTAIGEGIRAVRHYLDMSQESAAGHMGVALKTYREYEKASQRPRFNMLASAHYIIGMGVHPFYVLYGTHFVKVRKMQNSRIEVLIGIAQSIDSEVLTELGPLIDGFFESIRNLPNAQFYPLKMD